MAKGITYEQVAAACDELVAAGGKVSVRAVRSMVGGENAAVLRHIQRWRMENEKLDDIEAMISVEMRTAMAQEVRRHVMFDRQSNRERMAALETLNKEAQELLQAEEARGNELAEQLDAAKATTANTLTACEQREALATQRVEDANHRTQRAREESNQLRRELLTAQSEATLKAGLLEQAVTEKATLAEKAEILQGRLDAAHDLAAKHQADLAASEATCRSVQEQLADAKAAVANITRDLAEARLLQTAAENRASAAEALLAAPPRKVPPPPGPKDKRPKP